MTACGAARHLDRAIPGVGTPLRRDPNLVLLVGVGVIATLVRLWSSAGRTVASHPDEMRHLAMARNISGGAADWFAFGQVHRPGYAFLIAPLHWIVSEPEAVLEAALLVNAVLGGFGAILLVLIARRCTAVPLAWCAIAALLASLVPGAVLMGDWTTADTLLATVFIATLWASLSLLDRPLPGRAALALMLAVVGYLVHGRLGPLVMSVGALVMFLGVRRRLQPRATALLLVCTAAGVVLVELVAARVQASTWVQTRDSNTIKGVLSNFGEIHVVAQTMLGMSWYQLVSTVGVVGLGAGLALLAVFRPDASRYLGLRRDHLLTVWLLAAPALGLAAVSMDGPRASQIVYGRYWDALCAPFVMLGLLLLCCGSRDLVRRVATVVVPSMLVVGLFLWLLRQDDIDAAIAEYGNVSAGNRVLGLMVWLPSMQELPVMRLTLAATGIAGLLCAAVVFSPCRRVVAVRVAIPGILGVAAFSAVAGQPDPVEPHQAAVSAIRALADDSIVSYDERMRFMLSDVVEESPTFLEASERREYWVQQRWMLYQFLLPNREIALFDRAAPDAGDAHVFAPPDERSLVARSIVWEDPGPRLVLWGA